MLAKYPDLPNSNTNESLIQPFSLSSLFISEEQYRKHLIHEKEFDQHFTSNAAQLIFRLYLQIVNIIWIDNKKYIVWAFSANKIWLQI